MSDQDPPSNESGHDANASTTQLTLEAAVAVEESDESGDNEVSHDG